SPEFPADQPVRPIGATSDATIRVPVGRGRSLRSAMERIFKAQGPSRRVLRPALTVRSPARLGLTFFRRRPDYIRRGQVPGSYGGQAIVSTPRFWSREWHLQYGSSQPPSVHGN